MKEVWYKKESRGYERFLLSGDVGGTNTNLGLTGIDAKGKIDLLFEVETPSKQVASFPSLVKQTIDKIEADLPGCRVSACSVGANGPVKDNYCHIHNLEWQIDGNEVQRLTGLPTVVINDFSSVSYALPLIDVANPEQITCLNPGSPDPQAARAVVGAGTGMGVGFLARVGSKFVAFPSEGGHIDFAPFDQETEDFRDFVEKKTGAIPSVENCCSGIGIRNLYQFSLSAGWIKDSDAVVAEIERVGIEDAPRVIAINAERHPGCRKVLETFIKIYARFAANIAMAMLPRAGLYLAGGIGAKNVRYFLENDLFVKYYKKHYKPVIQGFIEEIPVYMIMNYNMSLIGSANAGLNLL